MSMIEKIARIIAVARAGAEVAAESEFKGGNLWADAKRDAGAVIQALREPSEAMEAAGDALSVVCEGYHPGAGPVWIAMIDAALSPSTTEG